MEWYYLMILLIAAVGFGIIYEMQKEINKQEKQIDKLHYENENYLRILSQEDILPEYKVIEKIQQMNDEYGEVKLKIM